MFAEIFNIQTVSLRYFNAYGERQNIDGAYATVLGIFAHQKLNNNPMTIRGDGEQKRDFTYVGDIVRANRLAMLSEKVGFGEAINIAGSPSLLLHIFKGIFFLVIFSTVVIISLTDIPKPVPKL